MLIICYGRFCSSLAGRFSFDYVIVYSAIGVLERERYILLLYSFVLFFFFCIS